MIFRRAAFTAAALFGVWAVVVLTSSRWLAAMARPKIETMLVKALESPAQVGTIRLGWTGKVLISAVQGEVEGIRFSAPSVSLRILPWKWLETRNVADTVSSVSLKNPKLEIDHWRDLIPLSTGTGEEPRLKPRTKSLPDIFVKNGEVVLAEIHPDLPVMITGKISDQGGRIRIRTPERSDFEVSFTGVGDQARTTVRVKKFFLSDSRKFIPKHMRPEKLGGFLGGSVELYQQDGKILAKGQLHLLDGKVSGGRWPLKVREARMTLNLDGQKATFEDAKVRLEEILFDLSGRIGLSKGGEFSLDAKGSPFWLSDLPDPINLGSTLRAKVQARLQIYGKPDDPHWEAIMYLHEGDLMGHKLKKGNIVSMTGTLDYAKLGFFRLEQEGHGFVQASGEFARSGSEFVPEIAFSARDFMLRSIPGIAEKPMMLMAGKISGSEGKISSRGSLVFESGTPWKKTAYQNEIVLEGDLSKPQLKMEIFESETEKKLLTVAGTLAKKANAWSLDNFLIRDSLGGSVSFQSTQTDFLRLTSGSIEFSSFPGLRDIMPGISGLMMVKGTLHQNLKSYDLSLRVPGLETETHTLSLQKEGADVVLTMRGFKNALRIQYILSPEPQVKLNLDGLELSHIEKLLYPPGRTGTILSGQISGQGIWSSKSRALTLLGPRVSIQGLGSGGLIIEDSERGGQIVFKKDAGQIHTTWNSEGEVEMNLENVGLGGLVWDGKLQAKSTKKGNAFFISLDSTNLAASDIYQGPFHVELAAGDNDFLIQEFRWGKAFRAQAKLKEGSVTGTMTVNGLKLAEVGWLPPGSISGLLNGTATLGGTPASLALDGAFSIENPGLGGIPVDEIKTLLKADGNKISWEGAFSKGMGKVSFTGSVVPGEEGPPLELFVHMTDGSFSDLLAFFPAKVLDPVSGQVQDAFIRAEGTLGSPRYEGRVIVNSGEIMGSPFDQFDGHFFLENGEFKFSNFDLSRGRGKLSLTDGSFTLGKGRKISFQGKIEAKDLDLAGVPVSGIAEVSGDTTGGDVRSSVVNIKSKKISVGESLFPHLDMKVESKGSIVVLSGKTKDEKGDLPIRGTVEVLPEGGIISKEPVVIGGLQISGRYDPAGISDLVAEGDEMEVAMVNPWLPEAWKGNIQGKGDFHIAYKGLAEDPLVTMNLNLHQGRLGQLPFTTLIALAQIRDGVLDLSPLGEPSRVVFGSGKSRLLASGRFPLKKESKEIGNLKLELIDGDLSLLQVFPVVKKASGPLDFKMSLTGSQSRPVMSLEVEAKDGRMDLTNILPKLKNIQFKYRVVDNVVEAGRFEAQAGRGRFHLQIPLGDNTVVLNKGIPEPLAFDLHTSEAPIEVSVARVTEGSSTGSLVLSGKNPGDPFMIRGTLEHPIVSGRAYIENMSFTWPPIVIPGEGSGYSLKSVEFDLLLESGRGLNYFRSAMGHTLRPEIIPGQTIHLRGRAADNSLGALAKLESRSGTFRLGRYNLDITEATLDILPIASGAPVLDADLMPYMEGRAETIIKGVPIPGGSGQKEDVRVIIDFHGKLHTVREEDTPLVINVNSEPPLDPDPEVNKRLLFEYMMFGKFVGGRGAKELPGSAAGTVFSLVEDRFNTELETQVNKNILGPITKGTAEIEIDSKIASNLFQSEEENPENSISATRGSILEGTKFGIKWRADQNIKLSLRARFERDVESDRDSLLKGATAEFRLKHGAKIELGIQEEFGPGLGKRILDPKIGFSIFNQFSEQGITDSSDHEPPKITEHPVIAESPGGVHIQIWTNEPSLCTLYLSDGGKEIWSSKERALTHEVKIKNLQAGESYEYYCRCSDLNKNEATLGPYRFTTGR